MSINNNPLTDKCMGPYGITMPVPPEPNRLTQLGIFFLKSLFGGIKMVGLSILLMFGGMAVLALFLGIPAFAFQLLVDGHYVFGTIMSIISLTIYGAGFNKTC